MKSLTQYACNIFWLQSHWCTSYIQRVHLAGSVLHMVWFLLLFLHTTSTTPCNQTLGCVYVCIASDTMITGAICRLFYTDHLIHGHPWLCFVILLLYYVKYRCLMQYFSTELSHSDCTLLSQTAFKIYIILCLCLLLLPVLSFVVAAFSTGTEFSTTGIHKCLSVIL